MNEGERLNEVIERRMVWDIMPHAFCLTGETFQNLKMPGSSPDGLELEHYESHVRIAHAEHILPVVTTLSGMAAGIISRAILADTENEVPEEVREIFANSVDDHVTAGAFAVILEMIDLGLLAVTGEGSYHE